MIFFKEEVIQNDQIAKKSYTDENPKIDLRPTAIQLAHLDIKAREQNADEALRTLQQKPPGFDYETKFHALDEETPNSGMHMKNEKRYRNLYKPPLHIKSDTNFDMVKSDDGYFMVPRTSQENVESVEYTEEHPEQDESNKKFLLKGRQEHYEAPLERLIYPDAKYLYPSE